MRIYQPEYKGADGRYAKKVSRWWVVVIDHNGARRKFAGSANRAQTEELGRRLQELADYRKSGLPLPAELTRWLQSLPRSLLEKLLRFGWIEPMLAASGRPLIDLLEDWTAAMHKRGCEPRYIRQAHNDVLQVIQACRWTYVSDINAADLQSFLLGLHDAFPIGPSIRSSSSVNNSAGGCDSPALPMRGPWTSYRAARSKRTGDACDGSLKMRT